MSEDRAQSIPPTAATPPVTLYDAGKEQAVIGWVEKKVNGQLKKYRVVHNLAPCDDETYVEFEKLLKQRYTRHKGNVVVPSADTRTASIYLYKKLLIRVVGWGPDDGSKVDEEQMEAVVRAFLRVEVLPRAEAVVIGDADEDRPWEASAEADDPVKLRALFDGRELTLGHHIRQESAGQRQRYDELTERKKYEAGSRMGKLNNVLPSNARGLGKLHDELCERCEGYAGKAPLWHRKAAVVAWMEQETEAEDDEGN